MIKKLKRSEFWILSRFKMFFYVQTRRVSAFINYKMSCIVQSASGLLEPCKSRVERCRLTVGNRSLNRNYFPGTSWYPFVQKTVLCSRRNAVSDDWQCQRFLHADLLAGCCAGWWDWLTYQLSWLLTGLSVLELGCCIWKKKVSYTKLLFSNTLVLNLTFAHSFLMYSNFVLVWSRASLIWHEEELEWLICWKQKFPQSSMSHGHKA